jgi:DUF1680 family protein
MRRRNAAESARAQLRRDTPVDVKRRDVLKALGLGATAGTVPCLGAFAAPRSARADWFALQDVRVEAGPFLDAQRRDADYLLRIDADRLLHNFRLNSYLRPKAPVYGGWESVEPWVEIRCHGHTLGHYLSAASCMYAATGDARFAERVDYIVTELAECQARRGDGALVAFPDGTGPLVDSLAGRPFAGVPWYTTHKILAGLRDAHLIRQSRPASGVMLRFCEWIRDRAEPVSDEVLQRMLEREHGGMNEVFADAFVLTGDRRYLTLSLRFCHRALLEPLAARRDSLDGLHSNTQIPKVIGFNRINEVHESAELAGAASFFWQTVTGTRCYATGGHGDLEHFFPRGEFAQRLGSGKTMETCCTHNMLRLTRSLYARDRQATYFDFFERALLNGILASQDPESGMNTYFQSTRPGYVRLYHTPFDSFWCCTGSGMENHARYGESIYARSDETLYVNLFIASTLTWRDRGLTLTQQTRFPDEPVTRMTIGGDKAGSFSLAIRQPAWCAAMKILVNGRPVKSARKPGTYATVTRRFKPGDVIEVQFPMKLEVVPLPGAPEYAALVYGPVVLAGRMGTQGLTPGAQLIVNERESGNMLDDKIDVPAWPGKLADLAAKAKRIEGDSLSFQVHGFEDDRTIDLIPWFRLTNERYNVYWRASST